MKFVKSLAVLSLSTLVGFASVANANTPQNQQKPAKSQPKAQKTAKEQKSQKAQKAQKAQPQKAQPQNTQAKPVANPQAELKRFSDSLSLRFAGLEATVENNQSIVHFKYQIGNKAKRTIKQVQWATIYYYNNQPVLVQDLPVNFNGGLKPNKSTYATFSVPFAHLPKAAQVALAEGKGGLSAQYQAKSILFSNGSKIVVK